MLVLVIPHAPVLMICMCQLNKLHLSSQVEERLDRDFFDKVRLHPSPSSPFSILNFILEIIHSCPISNTDNCIGLQCLIGPFSY